MIDLHVHSSVSDGTDAPEQLVAAAVSAGLEVIALCDHDTFDALPAATEAGQAAGLRVLRGVEMSAQLGRTSVHLLGYGCRGDDASLARELARIRQGRVDRVPAMLDLLAKAGMPVPTPVLERWVGDSPSVGRPHIADAMVELGYVQDRAEAFTKWLADDRPIYVARFGTELATAIALVRNAGGVAVVAHPWGRGSRTVLSRSALAALAQDAGLDGIEVDHCDHDEKDRAELKEVAQELGLLATGSSDYHGLGKAGVHLGSNTTSPEVLAEIERRVAARGGMLQD